MRWYLPALLVFVGTIALWELAVQSVDTQGFPLPAPSAITAALIDNWAEGRWPIGKSAAATLMEALGGLVIGTTAGVVVAGLTARFVTAPGRARSPPGRRRPRWSTSRLNAAPRLSP